MKYLSKASCLIALSLSLFLASCGGGSPQSYVGQRLRAADRVAEKYHFTKRLVKGDRFWVQTYQKIKNPSLPFVVYLEGDGLAFRNKYTISDDPTPLHPMLLSLAALDPRPNVVYIARPCQYVMEIDRAVCSDTYWSDKRMSEEIVRSINDVIVKVTDKKPVSLVGFSGGGGIAVLIAARNKQIHDILTIAGNLDHKAFNEYHKARPMIGSLNPIAYAATIRNIPQLHISGGSDKVVPAFIGDKFVQASSSPCVHQEIIPNATHQNGWNKVWHYILSSPIRCY